MSATLAEDQSVFSLDQVLRRFGLWKGGPIRHANQATRSRNLSQVLETDFSRPIIMSGASYDPHGHQIISVQSITTLDQDTGILDDRVVYWRHRPWGNADGGEPEDQYVFHFRGIVDDLSPREAEHVPPLMPEQIWWNGSQIFQGPHGGGADDPLREKHRLTAHRIVEISQRVKERLANQGDLHELLGDFQSADLHFDVGKAGMGSALRLLGLDAKGFDPIQSRLTQFFTGAIDDGTVGVNFSLLPILIEQSLLEDPTEDLDNIALGSLERLDATHGYLFEFINKKFQPVKENEKAATYMASGIPYVMYSLREIDDETGHISYRIFAEQEDVIEGQDKPLSFDIARVEYADDGQGHFELVDANFMGFGGSHTKDLASRLAIVGAIQTMNNALARGIYPDVRSIATECGLGKFFNEMGIPPGEDVGGEFKWVPLYGRNLDEKTLADFGGNEVGGGQIVISRVLKNAGTQDERISEVAMLHDFPLVLGQSESEYEGMNPDMMVFIEAIRNGGGIVLSHEHFDHRSIEFLAAMTDQHGDGWLKGVPVICRADVAYMVRKALEKVGVPKENYPDFMEYEKPDGSHDERLIKMGDKRYAYCARDEDGAARIWTQICAYGSKHTAPTDMHSFTGCYGDDHYKETFMTDGDSVGINDHGYQFLEEGQLALARLPEVSEEKLRKAIYNDDELYVGWDETTSLSDDSHAPTYDDVKDSMRFLVESLPKGKILSFHPLATNAEEIVMMREIGNEPDTLCHTVAVGASAQDHDTMHNKFGVDPFLDLRTVSVPAQNIPALLYEYAFEALDEQIEKRKSKGKFDPNRDSVYRVLVEIKNRAELEQKTGNPKPQIIFDTLFSNDPTVFESILQDLGIDVQIELETLKKLVNKSFDKKRKALMHDVIAKGINHESHLGFWVLRNIVTHGALTFKERCSWNEKAVYDALMRSDDPSQEQKYYSLRRGRTSNQGKAFRESAITTQDPKAKDGALKENPGGLIIWGTGVGLPDDLWSALARYARGESLYDYNELTRSTGFRIKEEDLVFFIPQTPTMGEDARKSQNQMIQDIVRNRGNTVFRAVKGGLEIYAPNEDLQRYLAFYNNDEMGLRAVHDANSNVIRISGREFHRSGHRRRLDMVNKYQDPRYKAKMVEPIHIGGASNHRRWEDTALQCGRRTGGIKRPGNFIALESRIHPKNAEPYLHETHALTPAIWAFNLRRKWGLQYGGVLQMVRHIGTPRPGLSAMEALDVRGNPNGHAYATTAWAEVNKAAIPRAGPTDRASVRQRVVGPSIAEVQTAGKRPRAVPKTALVRQELAAQRLKRQRVARRGENGELEFAPLGGGE